MLPRDLIVFAVWLSADVRTTNSRRENVRSTFRLDRRLARRASAVETESENVGIAVGINDFGCKKSRT